MLDDWPFGGFMCSIVPFTQSVSVFVSSYTMTAIAIDRYQATVCSIFMFVGNWTFSNHHNSL